MTNLDGILKSRDIILPTKVHTGKTLVFPVVLYGCKSWTIKKTEHWRTDSFELWCWRRLSESLKLQGDKPINPKGNQSWIFIGRTHVEAKTQYFVHLMQRADTLEKNPAGKDWRQEEKGMTEWDGWMASPTQWTWVWASSRRWWRTGKPGMLQSMGPQRVGHIWVTTQQQ